MSTTRWTFRLGAILLVALALTAWGCLAESDVHGFSQQHRAALHAVHADRLEAKMERINKQYRRVHRFPIRHMREREFRSVEHCAAEIARYATELPELVNLDELSPEHSTMFRTLAGQLKGHAEALKAAAAKQDRPAVREAFARMTSTCNACHSAFRQRGGEPNHGGS